MGIEVSTTSPRFSYVVDANGQPEAVIVDISTWQTILEQLEDIADIQILSQAAADLEALAKGTRPAGWQSWEEFEAELDKLEAAGELPN